MKNLFLIHKIDVKESLLSKWFLIYSLVFGGVLAVFFADGVGQYLIYEFVGLNKMLLMYIQISIIVLPIFVLITTITTIIKDKEQNTLEYMLIFPISLSQYYWGKFIGRLVSLSIPLFTALAIGIAYGIYQGLELELPKFFIYVGMLFSLTIFFLGVSFFVSSFLKSQEIALSSAFFIWMFFIAFIDIILLEVLLAKGASSQAVISLAVANPVELFRVASMMLFDSDLKMLGAVSYYILDYFSKDIFILISLVYPAVLGVILAFVGSILFKKKDLV